MVNWSVLAGKRYYVVGTRPWRLRLGKRFAACDDTMGKKGKKAQAGKAKKLTPKDIGKRLDALVKKLEEELEGADLFAPPPPMDDCPICLVRLSFCSDQCAYQACCGKQICIACFEENKNFIKKENKRNAGKKDRKEKAHTCPLCRQAEPADEEDYLRQLEAKFSSLGDKVSCVSLGTYLMFGRNGSTRKDELKGLYCLIKAAELGSPESCVCLGIIFREGIGLSIDMDKAALFDKVAAIRGDVQARHNIGTAEYRVFGNYELGIRHWKISAEAGYQQSLKSLTKVYNADGKRPGKEFISKEDMDKIYRDCHEAQEMIKSEEREKYLHEEDEMKC